MTRFIARNMRRWLLPFASLLCCSMSLAAPPLPALSAQVQGITVSGISSGAYMAVQYQVARSKSVSGVGAIAGGPYECAAGSTWTALTRCMSPNDWWAPVPGVQHRDRGLPDRHVPTVHVGGPLREILLRHRRLLRHRHLVRFRARARVARVSGCPRRRRLRGRPDATEGFARPRKGPCGSPGAAHRHRARAARPAH